MLVISSESTMCQWSGHNLGSQVRCLLVAATDLCIFSPVLDSGVVREVCSCVEVLPRLAVVALSPWSATLALGASSSEPGVVVASRTSTDGATDGAIDGVRALGKLK